MPHVLTVISGGVTQVKRLTRFVMLLQEPSKIREGTGELASARGASGWSRHAGRWLRQDDAAQNRKTGEGWLVHRLKAAEGGSAKVHPCEETSSIVAREGGKENMNRDSQTEAGAALAGDELTVRDLVALRLMLEDALRRARTAGRYARGSAVVALDATVERVTYLVAQSRSLTPGPRATLPDVYSKVKQDLGGSWEPRVWPLINKLHLERNKVQHQGLEPDRDQLPAWVQAVEAYVVSLVRAEYEIDIRGVVLADAIEDPDLSDLIRRAGEELEAGHVARSVGLALAAFDAAVDRWISMHAKPYRPPLGSFVSGVGHIGGPDHQDEEIKSLRRTSAEASFVPSLADHEWFRAARREQVEVLDADDAERILTFAFSWIASFTVAAREWVPDRRHRADVAARRVRRGGSQAKVAEVLSVDLRRNDYKVVFGLGGVPSEPDFAAWSEALQRLFYADERDGVWWWVKQDGTVNFSTRDGVVPAADDLITLTAAVARADDEVSRTAQAESERERALRAEADRREAQLATVRDQLPDWIESIGWGPPTSPPEHEGSWTFSVREVTLTDSGSQDPGRVRASLSTVVSDAIRDHDLVDGCFYSGRSGSLVMVPVVDVDDLVSILGSANEKAVEFLTAADASREEQRQAVAEVKAALSGALAALDQQQ